MIRYRQSVYNQLLQFISKYLRYNYVIIIDIRTYYLQMKQKWEARKIKEAKTKQLATNHQEAFKEAKKVIDREEKQKLARTRREEQEINREMVRIRKLMAEQARAEQEQKERSDTIYTILLLMRYV